MSDNLHTLVSWLAGDFSNREQAFATPSWFSHIRLCMRPIPWTVFDGYGLYSEQADDYDWKHPYRVRVLQLVELPDGTLESRNHVLKDESRWLGACREPERLAALTTADFEQLPGCTMVFEREGDIFKGRIKGKGCRVFRKGQETYLDSEATVAANLFTSLDRGLALDTDKQVWGSVSGPFHFLKREDFAHEVAELSRR